MKTKQLPDQDTLRSMFSLDYSTGVLYREGRPVGTKDRYGYLYAKVNGSAFKVHRLVFMLVNGYCPQIVDHINGVRDDNRPANLRPASPAESQRNKAKSCNNTTGFKGVYFDRSSKKYRASFKLNGKINWVGSFINPQDAAEALAVARATHHKEYANHG